MLQFLVCIQLLAVNLLMEWPAICLLDDVAPPPVVILTHGVVLLGASLSSSTFMMPR